jgi:vancomycin resistance protein YoaR
VVVTVFLLRWETGMDGSVYPGVKVGGVDVGGKSLSDARQRLQQESGRIASRTITVSGIGQSWTITPQQLGMQFNVDSLLHQAYGLGREDSILSRLGTQVRLALQGQSISLAGSYDSGKLNNFVAQLAIDVYQPAQPAVVSLQNAKAVISEHAAPGRKLDQQAATSLLADALSGTQQTKIRLPVMTIPPPVTEAAAQHEVAALQSILGAKLRLHFDNRQWLLSASSIAQSISLTTVVASGGAATYQHSVDQSGLTRYVDELAGEIDRPMQPATVTIHDAHITVVPAQTGYSIDRYATKQRLAQAILAGGTQDITLPGGTTDPSTSTSAATIAAQHAAELIRRPLALTYRTYSWLLGPTQLGDMLTFVPRTDSLNGPVLDVRVDQTRLAKVLQPAVASLERPAVNASFSVKGNRVVLSPSIPGQRVDIAALASAIEGRGRIMQLPLPVQSYEPELTTAKAEAMGVHDLLLSHTTVFPGSSAARLTNIHAAVLHLDGQLIAPDETYSFNQRIGDITAAGGYVEGIDIIDNQDVPGIGGGVCQVAVTLFQAAVYAGMPIVERSPHANVVSFYNPIGMDATVYVSANGPDVKFQNNTGHWVLVSFVEDLAHDKLTVQFFGTNPHFRVVVRGPDVTNLPNGDVDAVFYRTVYDAKGNVLLDHAFSSHYVPVGASPNS